MEHKEPGRGMLGRCGSDDTPVCKLTSVINCLYLAHGNAVASIDVKLLVSCAYSDIKFVAIQDFQ